MSDEHRGASQAEPAAPVRAAGGRVAGGRSGARGAGGAFGFGGFSGVEAIAALASLLWIIVLVLILVFARTEEGAAGGFDAMTFVMTLMAVFLPVALIWVAAIAMRSARLMQAESRRLQAAVDAISAAQRAPGTALVASPPVLASPVLERKLDEIARAQRKTEAAIATFVSIRSAEPAPVHAHPGPLPEASARSAAHQPSPAPMMSEQPSLALEGAGAVADPLPVPVLISALNFPESPEDTEGFRALRRALGHRPTAQLIQASQDVLTLLSQDGIYMDDLIPDRARPELWRRFAEGERGGTIAPLGGIRDRSALSMAAGRMRQDTIFRDAVHHFLRKFDQMLAGFGPEASDAELAALAETRTARAFMLLGRVTGAFD